MKRIGYGQVEPNHLSAQRNGQIYAQLPLAESLVLENGMFAKYDMAAGNVNVSGTGEWMLVYNEVKVYDVRESVKDFVIKGSTYPRLLKTNVGDIFTTNTFAIDEESGEMADLELGATLVPGSNGYLVAGSTGDMIWKVVKAPFTMPDGQPAVKVQRIK